MNLFKKAQSAIEQRVKVKSHDESVLRQSRLWMNSITWGLIGTTAFAISWLTFAKTEEIVVVAGKLEPIGSVRDIQLPVGGTAINILVKEGEKVLKDQVLMRLDPQQVDQDNKSFEERLALSKKQLKLKNVEFDRFKGLNKSTISTLAEKLSFENEILDRLKSLSELGASSELQYLQQRNTVQEVQGRHKEAILDGLRQQSIIEQSIQKLKSDISVLESDLTEARVMRRYQVLRAPVNGVVFDLQPTGVGYTARPGDVVMKIVPMNKLEAKVEIPSRDIGFVRQGMSADISIDSFPATDFGVLEGFVSQLGSDALPPDPSIRFSEYRYPATISISSQDLILNNGKTLNLQPGMSLTANIKLRKVSYLQLLLAGFQDKVSKLKEI